MPISTTAVEGNAVSLLNCADEAIHIPGYIQPHGALLVFEEGRLIGLSSNATDFLHLEQGIGAPAALLNLDPKVLHAVSDCQMEMLDGETVAIMLETHIGGRQLDCVIHALQGRVIAEFEIRAVHADEVAHFALMAYGAVSRIKRQSDLGTLLQVTVEQIRKITGFDRVMAYRFHSDDSGEVVAEEHAPELTPYLHMRYPASDIPSQARRLYIINTLRVIADVSYVAVPVAGIFGDVPLDMSHCVLRSVSPIHVEYLRNMGVDASMSVSIVLNGRLWGLIACHHMGVKQVPYSIRMACDVIAQVLASTVQTLETRAYAKRVEIDANLQSRIIDALLNEEDVLRLLGSHAAALKNMLSADGLIVTQFGRQLVEGDIPSDIASLIVGSLPLGTGLLVTRDHRSEWPEPLRLSLEKWVGLLAWCFDPATDGWIIAMRIEQIQTIRWAGKETDVKPGPLGKRLTPRGSFEEWRETVCDRAEMWDAAVLHGATRLASEMNRASVNRHAETERTRTQLFAMLGHDLRDPLHTIQIAASMIKNGDDQHKLGRRIFSSSSRMQRLISQVMDISRINGGIGIGLFPARVNVIGLVEDMVEESHVGHPDVAVVVDMPAVLYAHVDGDRIAQVLGNLISNARNYGMIGKPISIQVRGDENAVSIKVKNFGPPIPEATVGDLFKPFKQLSVDSIASRRGLGLGLFITYKIVAAHRGTIDYAFEDGQICFAVSLPANTAPVHG